MRFFTQQGEIESSEGTLKLISLNFSRPPRYCFAALRDSRFLFTSSPPSRLFPVLLSPLLLFLTHSPFLSD